MGEKKKMPKLFENRINTSKFKLSRFTDTESNLLEMFSFLLETESMSLCVVKCLVFLPVILHKGDLDRDRVLEDVHPVCFSCDL